MRTIRLIVLLGLVLGLSISLTTIRAQQGGGTVAVDADDIGGVVTGARGPEAGVWVIAETRDLPTRLIKIVVTNDQGRYLLPDLPKANYDVWVRGYGLVDSQKVQTVPGKALNLTAVTAPNAQERPEDEAEDRAEQSADDVHTKPAGRRAGEPPAPSMVTAKTFVATNATVFLSPFA